MSNKEQIRAVIEAGCAISFPIKWHWVDFIGEVQISKYRGQAVVIADCLPETIDCEAYGTYDKGKAVDVFCKIAFAYENYAYIFKRLGLGDKEFEYLEDVDCAFRDADIEKGNDPFGNNRTMDIYDPCVWKRLSIEVQEIVKKVENERVVVKHDRKRNV